MSVPFALLISGRGSNMAAILKECQSGVLQGVAKAVVVVSNKPQAPGLQVAHSHGIPTLVVPSKNKNREEFERELIAKLRPFSPQYIVLAGFMRILSPFFIRAYQGRIINIHPADTAVFQGLGGYQWAWEQKLSTTYVTVHFVDEGVDTGPVIAKYPVDLSHCHTLQEVEQQGLTVEHKVYSQALYQVFSGKVTYPVNLKK